MKNVKHKHGTPNPIIEQEEEGILTSVDRALASSSNSQIIGRNGEVPLRNFLKRYLPYSIRAETGHFVAPSGKLSPEIDVLILDARYPLLSENTDGSVLAMMHSVISTIEVKTRIRTTDINKMWSNSALIGIMSSEIIDKKASFGGIQTIGLAYKSQNRLRTIADKFFKVGQAYLTKSEGYMDLFLLRLPEKDVTRTRKAGAFFHFEGNHKPTENNSHTPFLLPMHTPLSDFYYMLIQDSYYCLDARDYNFNDIGEHFMAYMSWSTFSPKGH